MTIATENLPDEIEALTQIIADLARDAVVAQAEIAKLKFQLARYRHAAFGRSSESWRRTSPSSNWQSRPWKPTEPSGWPQARPRWPR